MSKVLLDHMPARTPPERRAAPAPTPRPGRSRIEAGILGLALAAILVFAASFAMLFPETERSAAFWPTYRDPAGVFELRYPRGWDPEPTARGVRLSDDAMTIDVGVLSLGRDATVDGLAQHRMTELADLGAAESALVDTSVDGRPVAAIRALAAGDGRMTMEVFVQAGPATFVTVAATAPPGRFDQATFDEVMGTLEVGAGVHAVQDRVGQSRP